jgi:hypothetical protein
LLRVLEAVLAVAELLGVNDSELEGSCQDEDETLRQVEDLLDEEILHLKWRELHTCLLFPLLLCDG